MSALTVQLQMSKLESMQAAVAGTASPKRRRVRSKSRSSGERCMSDQSDTDMDTSSAVRHDQTQASTPAPVLGDAPAHSETADKASAAGESLLIFHRSHLSSQL